MANEQKLDLVPAAAATLSACIGTFCIGLFTILAHASGSVKGLLNWWNPAGPLSGKTGLSVIIWLVLWAILHSAWKGKEVDFAKIAKVSFILLALGFLAVFPPFFDLF